MKKNTLRAATTILFGALCCVLPAAAQIYSGAVPAVETESSVTVTSNSVIMHGIVTPNGNPTQVWFEYGTSTFLGLRSPFRLIGTQFQSTRVNFHLTPFELGATYYFRMAGESTTGRAVGQVFSFTAPGAKSGLSLFPASTSAPGAGFFFREWPNFNWRGTPSSAAPTSSAPGAVFFSANADNPSPREGESVAYTFTYRNGEPTPVTNAHILLTVPPELEYLGATPVPAISGRILDFTIGTLSPGIEERLTVPFKVASSAGAGTTVTVASRLEYTEQSGARRSMPASFALLIGQGVQTAVISGVISWGAWIYWIGLGFIILMIAAGLYLLYRYLRVRKSLSH